MLNEWRGAHRVDLTTRAKYEGNIAEHLSRGCDSAKESIEVDPLVQRIMYEKFENKYKGQLSNTQKTINNYGTATKFAKSCGLIFQKEACAVVEAIGPQVQVTSGDISVVYQGDVILGRLAMGADFLNPAAAVELVAGIDVSSNFNNTAVSNAAFS